MKQILFLIMTVFLSIGCSKENEEVFKYQSIEINVESTAYYSTEQEPIQADAIIEIYEGSNLEKRDISKNGIAYDNSLKQEVKALYTAKSHQLIFDNAKIGKSYFVFVKYIDDKIHNYKINSYSYTVIQASGKEGDIIEIKKIFSNNARPNQYEDWNYDLTKNNSDFYVGRFGDERKYIIDKERSALLQSSGSYDKFFANKYTNRYYFYQSGRIFYYGEDRTSYQLSAQYPQLINTCLADYRIRITKMKEQYGEPYDKNVDIYSFNNSSDNYWEHDDFIISQEIMNGFKEFIYKFKKDRLNITCRLSKFYDGIQTQAWAYTITTSYEENK